MKVEVEVGGLSRPSLPCRFESVGTFEADMARAPEKSRVSNPLRDYQSQLVKQVYANIKAGERRQTVVSPTGSGKTQVFLKIIEHAVERGRRVMLQVNLDPLVQQTYERLKRVGITDKYPVGFIKAGFPEDPDALIQIASQQTMSRRLESWLDMPLDLVIYDEVHLTGFSQIGLDCLNLHQDAVHLGFTATPWRLKRAESLSEAFPCLTPGPLPGELQDREYLSQMDYFCPPTDDMVDLGDVRVKAGDYDARGAAAKCNTEKVTQSAIRYWREMSLGKRTIAFTCDVKHAEDLANAFNSEGIPAAYVTGSTPTKTRHDLYGQLKAGEILVLVSCNVLSIGFDEPAVETGLLLRPTQSKALHFQQVGRVMRISPQTGKTRGLILDFVGNLTRHGLPEDLTEWAFEEAKDNCEMGGMLQKLCPRCEAEMSIFERECPECGYTFDGIGEQGEVEVELVKLEPKRNMKDKPDPEKRKAFRGLRQLGFKRGYLPGAAYMEYVSLFEERPPRKWCRGAIFGANPSDEDRQEYLVYLQCLRDSKARAKPRSWERVEFNDEFGEGAYEDYLARMPEEHTRRAKTQENLFDNLIKMNFGTAKKPFQI